VINVSNSTSKNNPLRLIGTPAGPTRPSGLAGPAQPAARRPGRPGLAATGIRGLHALATAGQILLSWLAALPGRLGDRLFTMNDTEAYWRDWQIIKAHGRLGRRYRDPRFDLLAECQQCRGAGSTANRPCPPCLGTGRITPEEI
jgi:hypothetical protein